MGRLDASVGTELVQRLHEQPPEFLEKAVLRLLVAMGYGGGGEAAQHLGGPGDGGFDGVINQDRLGLGRVYVQAKRYAPDNIVGRPASYGDRKTEVMRGYVPSQRCAGLQAGARDPVGCS